MKHLNSRLALIVMGAAVAGMLLAQSDDFDDESDSDLEWEMFGQQVVAGDFSTGSALGPMELPVFEGTSFLYNKRTGEVYRVFLTCGEELGINGCMEKLPVVGLGNFPPSIPPLRTSPNQIRR